MSDDPTKLHARPKLVDTRDAVPTGPAVKIELDERCFLFPDGKVVKHMVIGGDRNAITLEGVFDFNETRRSSLILDFTVPEATGFARELANAAYYAKTSIFLTDGLQATINVAQHGCLIEFLKFDTKVELMVSVPATWRLIRGILCAVDARGPRLSH